MLGPLALNGPGLEDELRALDQWGVWLWIELTRVCHALHEAKIDFLLLKGPALALTVYRRPNQRLSSDIDILVAAEDLEAACDALATVEYSLDHSSISLALYERHHFHWVLRNAAGGALELHWNLSRPHDYFSYDPSELMDRAQTVEVGGIPVRVPSDLDQLLHAAGQASLCCFADLRRPVDCAFLLRRGRIEETRLVEMAQRQNLGPALWTLLWQQSQLTGVEVPQDVERSLRPRGFKRRLLQTMASLEVLLDDDATSAQRPSFALSESLCAPRVGAALRVMRRALFPGPEQFLGYDGGPATPPALGRRLWTALKTAARLSREFLSLSWRALLRSPTSQSGAEPR
jgi:hypothetical protein